MRQRPVVTRLTFDRHQGVPFNPPENGAMRMTTKRIASGNPRRAGWRTLVTGLLVAFVALLPVADAFCAIHVPQPDAPAPTSSSDVLIDSAAEDGYPASCCEPPPPELAASDCKTDASAAATGWPPERPLASASRAFQPWFLPLPQQTIRIDLPPPPEPPFRRLKRLLI